MPSDKLAWGISVGNEAASFVLDERFSTEKETEEFIAKNFKNDPGKNKYYEAVYIGPAKASKRKKPSITESKPSVAKQNPNTSEGTIQKDFSQNIEILALLFG